MALNSAELSNAAGEIDKLLAGATKKPEKEKQAKAAPGETDNADTDTQDDDVSDTADTGDSDTDSDEPEDQPDGDDQDDQSQEDEEGDEPKKSAKSNRLFEVPVDGEVIKVTEEELIKGYSRQSSYSKRMAEFAEERKKLDEGVNAMREQYKSRLEAQMLHLEHIDPVLKRMKDLPKLAEEDPDEYVKISAQISERQKYFAKLKAEHDALRAEDEAKNLEEQKQFVTKQFEQLTQKRPEWASREKFQKDYGAIAKAAEKHFGLTPQEMGQVIDHRHVLVLEAAVKYAESKQALGGKVEKAKAADKVMRSGGGEKTKPNGFTAQLKTLKKTGKRQDAARMIESMLG